MTSIGYDKFVEESFILDPKNNVLKNNKFKIQCKIRIKKSSEEDKEEEEEVETHSAINASLLKKVDRFELLLKNKEFSDVTIIAHDKNFNLHKCILAAFSDVFETMLKSDMKEKSQNTVEIADIKYEVLQELFRFIYTGEVNEINDVAAELLVAADKYHVIGLKALCEETMADNLTKDNAIEYLNLAVDNNAEHLKADIINWLSLRLESFIFKPEFHEFGKLFPELLIEITQKSYSNLL